ncbi:Ras GTPase activator [Cordyceps militaris CM01]|uniref:Ras GTPase activator n=1 Tax=Cordyceps militaris (strain CM01) TaxID=983644 RepID=G3JPV0_CORMM|nr:Ras GTPase activator [Cordyceps militaris CM01]EGX89201.1 Ras GTPase activator [Cordyceps militaris CM01]
MSGDAGLVGYLVDRIAAKLPHCVGASGARPDDDEVVQTTQATLIKLSKTTAGVVIDSLLDLLEDLSRPFAKIATHPSHILQSELYVLSLVSACCSANWSARKKGGLLPEKLGERVVVRLFEVFKSVLEPIPDDYVLPAQTLLDQTSVANITIPRPGRGSAAGSTIRFTDGPESLDFQLVEIDRHVKVIVEYMSVSSWTVTFSYIRSVIHTVRSATGDSHMDTAKNIQQHDRGALIILRLLSFCWVDGSKLGLLIQELCSSYLHFRGPYQNTVAVAIPLLITRWIDRYPDEFVMLHRLHKRLDGGADTLFDMTQTATETGRRRVYLFPLQTTLLFLMPDVFEVASNLRETKGHSVIKKVSFLDSLRKALRNGNEQAGYCLVSLLRVARHFDVESDSALVSYAMDVQDEVRDAIFRPSLASATALPVWDQSMITAALVSLSYLNLDGCVYNLYGGCVASSAPDGFKLAMIQACCYFAQLPDPEKYKDLFEKSIPLMRKQLETEAHLHHDKKHRDQERTKTRMICSIMKFLSIDQSPIIGELSGTTSDSSFFKTLLLCAVSAEPAVRQHAAEVIERLHADLPILLSEFDSREEPDMVEIRRSVWIRSSTILLRLSDCLVDGNDQSALAQIYHYLKDRLILLRKLPGLSHVPSGDSDSVASISKLETALLVSLCFPGIEDCEIAASCLNILVEECRWVDSHSESVNSCSAILRNADTFQEISSPTFRVTGLVAFQKRTRSLLRQIKYPTAGIIRAWEAAFDTWLNLSKQVSVTSADATEAMTLSQWRDLGGFLASMGGICTAQQAVALEEPALNVLPWIDLHPPGEDQETLLARYLHLGVQLMGCTNVKVRETIRDIFTHEVPTCLYRPLFKSLESEVEAFFTGAFTPDAERAQDRGIIFAEQAVSLLKDMVERLDTPQDLAAAPSVHLGSLTLAFAKFIGDHNETGTSLRVKIRICQLSEAVMHRKEHLNLRDDVVIRNQLLEYIIGWIRPPGASLDSGRGTSRLEELERMQRDLTRACLKALSDLTFRLPLQTLDIQSDAGMSAKKSELFQRYFKRFLDLISTGQSDVASEPIDGLPSSEMAITILSNLLSANIDIGLKHALSHGYHDSVEVRTVFVKVLYNILTQGTEFSNLSDSAVSERYEELLGLLTKDLSLAVSMSSICPSAEIDELTVCLLIVFEQRGRTFELLEALIKEEIEQTEHATEILRRSCVATKMLSLYAKWKGFEYLQGTLQKILDRLMMTSQELDLELDPARVSSAEELKKNAAQLQIVTKVFMDEICASAPNIPPSFRKICSIIHDAVLPRFPDAKYTAVGAFVFLRFFCPAIVAPEAEGLIDAPPTKELRRGLLLIAKVIQNLANNVLFGTKEPYMFPLNKFLVVNISVVTGFLRAIAVPPASLDLTVTKETTDFGSCVSFHRFLYDHWDHLRQTLVARERREYLRLQDSSPRSHSPVFEPLRNLITNLGPPPLAISWNRPQIAVNQPPLYSRFQNFMLRNAFRSTESFLTSRTIFDGGDGLSTILIILRYSETEGIDHETLLHCFLKIASRLWHEPFSVLIDATCYSGKNDPKDEFFKMLDLLMPYEVLQNLSRIYIYNMNSAFKRCFRRLLRIVTKNELSAFHPNNVKYLLFGSLDDVRHSFFINSLQVPKEHSAIVSDIRYVCHHATRLSKSKGKVDVIIKVGSHHVQVTTSKHQEIFSSLRLSSTINDIFRLGDIDEAATAIPSEDGNSFGLRADGGRIVMCFTSNDKAKILHAIRSAKARNSKDSRMHKPVERLLRPQDVPGTLLNLAFMNLSSLDHQLRLASYNLLGALCITFKFRTATRLVCSRDLSIPIDPTRFIVSISRELAASEPQLTCDFLSEFIASWETFTEEQKPLSLAYMAPWLSGLRRDVLTGEVDGEKGKEKVAAIFRKFIDLIALDQSLSYALEQFVWPSLGQDEVLLDIFLEEVMKMAIGFGTQQEIVETVASTVSNIGTICTSLSFGSGVQSQLFLPEIFHIVTMLVNTGGANVRVQVHRLLTNTVHAICTSFLLDESKFTKLRASLDVLSEPRSGIFSSPPSGRQDAASASLVGDEGSMLPAMENLVAILFDICTVAAPSVDTANAWRSRWMSLVASTAFQNNPAVQPRAFAVMGYLAKEEVDDDLLYQVLVALRNSVSQFGEDGHSEMLTSIITCLSRMMANLPSASRYGLQLFWLAMSLIRLVPGSLFNCTAQFLEALLINIGNIGGVRGDKMIPMLLHSRSQLDEAVEPLDEAYGIHFDEDNFHFAVCACLVRGLTDNTTRLAAVRVLWSFLEMTAPASQLSAKLIHTMVDSPYLALMLARCVDQDNFRDNMWLAGINPDGISGMLEGSRRRHAEVMEDRDLLLISVIELVDFQYLEDTVQARTLLWLNDLALSRRTVFAYLCGAMPSILNDVLMHGQDSAALEAAHTLVRTLTSEREYASATGSMESLEEALEEMGFRGLWKLSFQGMAEENRAECFELTEKLIELIVI